MSLPSALLFSKEHAKPALPPSLRQKQDPAIAKTSLFETFVAALGATRLHDISTATRLHGVSTATRLHGVSTATSPKHRDQACAFAGIRESVV